MKRLLCILALVLAVASSMFWLVTGASGGWTKTSLPVRTVDEVTGIEGIEYRKKFVPGIDFLGGALLGAALLAAGALFLTSKPSTHKT